MEQRVINFDDYITLHKSGYSIHDIEPLDNETYKVFSSSNVDVRIIDKTKNYSLLTATQRLESFISDGGVNNQFFYSVPIQTPSGDYVGFIYRHLFGHSYASIYRPFNDKVKKVPFMFGFYRDFDKYDRHTKCMPIVVCEGIKDAMVLKKLYPYVLSNNTSALRLNAEVIANITDKVILAYDNDNTGIEQSLKDKRKLGRLGCSVDILKYENHKDAGEYINHPQELKKLREQLKLRLKGLIEGVTLAI